MFFCSTLQCPTFYDVARETKYIQKIFQIAQAQPDYSLQWIEYYRKMGLFEKAAEVEKFASEQNKVGIHFSRSSLDQKFVFSLNFLLKLIQSQFFKFFNLIFSEGWKYGTTSNESTDSESNGRNWQQWNSDLSDPTLCF